MLNSLRDTICMSFIYSEDDNILVFDGGFPFEYENLYTHLKKLGTHVHTWFFSHPHIDHIGAFCELMEKYGDDITVDNLCLKYTGVHGVGAGTVNDLTVQNCEFGWIGGSVQGVLGSNKYETRFGNAVEIYGGCENYTVQNNYIYQILSF